MNYFAGKKKEMLSFNPFSTKIFALMKILFLKQIYLTAKSFKKLHSNYYTPEESLSFGKNFS